MDLYEEIRRLIAELDISVKNLRKSGTEYAQAEQNYKIKLREEALKLRADEQMPVTLINQIIYGVPEVARLRFERDVKEAVYQANQEAINSIKLKLRILENQLRQRMGEYKMIWRTKTGQEIDIKDMTTQHIKNCIKAIEEERIRIGKTVDIGYTRDGDGDGIIYEFIDYGDNYIKELKKELKNREYNNIGRGNI